MSDGTPCVDRLVLFLWIPGVQIVWSSVHAFPTTRDTKERDLVLAATLASQTGYL